MIQQGDNSSPVLLFFTSCLFFSFLQHEPTTNKTDKVRTSISSQTNKLCLQNQEKPTVVQNLLWPLFLPGMPSEHTFFFLLSNKETAGANVPGEWSLNSIKSTFVQLPSGERGCSAPSSAVNTLVQGRPPAMRPFVGQHELVNDIIVRQFPEQSCDKARCGKSFRFPEMNFLAEYLDLLFPWWNLPMIFQICIAIKKTRLQVTQRVILQHHPFVQIKNKQ